jgi:hypothetical protein
MKVLEGLLNGIIGGLGFRIEEGFGVKGIG